MVAGRLAGRLLISVLGQAGGGPDPVVGGAAARDGRRPQHLLRRVRHALHSRQQQRGQPRRQRAPRGVVSARRRGQEFLGGVGVPFRSLHERVEGGGGQGERG